MQPDPRTDPGWQRDPVPPVTGWWFLVPLLTFGLGTPAMVLLGAVRLRSTLDKIFAGGYFAGLVTMCMISGVTDSESPDAGWGVLLALLYFTVWFGGTVHTAILQSKVRNAFFRDAAEHHPPGFGPATPRPGLTHYPAPSWHQSLRVDPALAAAQWRMARREEARRLQAGQPGLAAELMIGRPDLPGRQYDDGGLVDVNHVPAEWLMRYLSIERPLAEQIVASRDLHNGFTTPDELIVYCDGLTPAKLATFRDRLVFNPR